jgi:hypothetical protein
MWITPGSFSEPFNNEGFIGGAIRYAVDEFHDKKRQYCLSYC